MSASEEECNIQEIITHIDEEEESKFHNVFRNNNGDCYFYITFVLARNGSPHLKLNFDKRLLDYFKNSFYDETKKAFIFRIDNKTETKNFYDIFKDCFSITEEENKSITNYYDGYLNNFSNPESIKIIQVDCIYFNKDNIIVSGKGEVRLLQHKSICASLNYYDYEFTSYFSKTEKKIKYLGNGDFHTVPYELEFYCNKFKNEMLETKIDKILETKFKLFNDTNMFFDSRLNELESKTQKSSEVSDLLGIEDISIQSKKNELKSIFEECKKEYGMKDDITKLALSKYLESI